MCCLLPGQRRKDAHFAGFIYRRTLGKTLTIVSLRSPEAWKAVAGGMADVTMCVLMQCQFSACLGRSSENNKTKPLKPALASEFS